MGFRCVWGGQRCQAVSVEVTGAQLQAFSGSATLPARPSTSRVGCARLQRACVDFFASSFNGTTERYHRASVLLSMWGKTLKWTMFLPRSTESRGYADCPVRSRQTMEAISSPGRWIHVVAFRSVEFPQSTHSGRRVSSEPAIAFQRKACQCLKRQFVVDHQHARARKVPHQQVASRRQAVDLPADSPGRLN